MYPLNPGGVYRGNETQIAFRDYQPVIVNPYELKAVCTNVDTAYDHTFYVGLAMQRPEELGTEIPQSSLIALSELIGQEIEVG